MSRPCPVLRSLPWLAAALLTWGLAAAPRVAHAAPNAEELARFHEATEALARREPGRAIELLERLADRGVRHPDVSYDRGVAYLERAESAAARPGDLGQAAAAFREATLLSPGDEAAEAGFEEAQLRVARCRARGGDTALLDTEPLALRTLSLLSPSALFWIGLVGSVLATLGVLVSRSRRPNLRLAARIVAGLGLLALVPAAALDAARSSLVSRSTPAVVVGERATALDAAGRPLSALPALVEGQAVYVLETRGRLARVATSDRDVWVPAQALRLLPRPH